jgi:hypothetical protein
MLASLILSHLTTTPMAGDNILLILAFTAACSRGAVTQARGCYALLSAKICSAVMIARSLLRHIVTTHGVSDSIGQELAWSIRQIE